MIHLIKDILKKRLIIIFISLSVFILTLLFPEMNPQTNNLTITYNSTPWSLYIPNKDQLASRITVMSKSDNIEDKAKEIISYLTIGSANTIYLPDAFFPIIPYNTTIKNIKIENKILHINFSKELLSLNKNNARLAIECITYSLLEIESIEGIILYVDNVLLTSVPETNERITYPLTRQFGINRINKIQNIKNTSITTSYYKANEKNYFYSIPVTTIQNSNQNKIEIVIEELKSNPHIKTNITSYLKASTELENYETLENEIKLSFKNLLDEEIIEETTYAISLSLRDTLNISKVEITKPLEQPQ